MENDGIKLVLAIQHAAVDSASGLDVTPEDIITALCSVTVGMTIDLAKEGFETEALLVMMKVINGMVLGRITGEDENESSFVQRHH